MEGVPLQWVPEDSKSKDKSKEKREKAKNAPTPSRWIRPPLFNQPPSPRPSLEVSKPSTPEKDDEEEVITEPAEEKPVPEKAETKDPKPLAVAETHDDLKEIPLVDHQPAPEATEPEAFEDIMAQEMGGNRGFVESTSASGKLMPIEEIPPTPEAPPSQPFDIARSSSERPMPEPAPAVGELSPAWASATGSLPPSPERTASAKPEKSWSEVLKEIIPPIAKVAGAAAEAAGWLTNPHLAAAEFVVKMAAGGALGSETVLPGGLDLSRSLPSSEQISQVNPIETSRPFEKPLFHPSPSYEQLAAQYIAPEDESAQPVLEKADIGLKRGEQLVHGAASYAEVVDQHGRVIKKEAFQHGSEYQRDRQREMSRPDTFSQAGAAATGGVYAGQVGMSTDNNVRLDPSHELGSGPTVDLQHRLPTPSNPVVSTLTSPWLWTAIAILLIIYFLASLA